MVPLSYGNSEHVAHAWRIKCLFGENNPICDCSRSDQMTLKDQITEFASYITVLQKTMVLM